MKALTSMRTARSPLARLAQRLLPPRDSLRTRVLREARRQGIRGFDASAGAMLRLSLCVARHSAVESFPAAVARCLGQGVTRAAARRTGRKRYRRSEVLEELRRQHVDFTNASAGWMLRLMACVSAQLLSQSLPDSVSACLRKQVGRGFRSRWSGARPF
jgi:hypothetical protein